MYGQIGRDAKFSLTLQKENGLSDWTGLFCLYVGK